MSYGVVYKCTNKINGKCYIGQTTKSLDHRIKRHFKVSKFTKYHFHKALNKYGQDSFKWEVIGRCFSREELNKMEIYYIEYFDTYKYGYNSTKGGEGNISKCSDKTKEKISNTLKEWNKYNENPLKGKKHTEESRRNMSLAQKGKHVGKNNHFYGKTHTLESRKKISDALMATENHPNRGKHLSEEWKRKIGESNKGKIISQEQREKISKTKKGKFVGKESKTSKKYIITDPDGNEFLVVGLQHFSRIYKNGLLDNRLLSKVVEGKRNHHRQYKCRHYNEETDSHLFEYYY